MSPWAIVFGACVVLIVIMCILGNVLLTDKGRHADNRMIDELNERVSTPRTTPPPDDTIAQCNEAIDWWRMRSAVILSDIIRDEEYWQRIIDSGHLGKAHWLREIAH